MARRASILAAVVIASLTAALARGQDLASVPSTVEAAEAEGAKHPKSDGTEQAVYADAFGPAERRCVDADSASHNAVRSGDFVAGPFDRHVFAGNPQSPQNARRKVWWAPRQGTELPPMQLRAAKVDAPDVTVTWNFPSVVSNQNGRFYNTFLRFPASGKWLAVVTAGDNWGCFLMEEISPGALK